MVALRPRRARWQRPEAVDPTLIKTLTVRAGDGSRRSGRGRGGSEEGTYENGKKHGRWVVRTAKGGIRSSLCTHGKCKIHGRWLQYFKSGGSVDGPYVDGKMHGTWVSRGASSAGSCSTSQYEPPWLSRRLHLVRKRSRYGKTFDTLSGGGSRTGANFCRARAVQRAAASSRSASPSSPVIPSALVRITT